MSSPNINRAIELAGKVAHAEATGQPNLAALYEANMIRAMQEARTEIAHEQLKTLVGDAVDNVTNILKAVFGAVENIIALLKDNPSKNEYALVGPGGNTN